MVDYPSVDLLWNPFVEATVPSFHMEDRDFHSFGCQRRQTTVRVSENQHCVRLHLGEQIAGFRNHLPDCLCGILSGRIKKVIGLPYLQVLKEYLVKLVVIVLTSVNQYMIRIAVQCRNHPRQPDDLRASAQNGCYFHAVSKDFDLLCASKSTGR